MSAEIAGSAGAAALSVALIVVIKLTCERLRGAVRAAWGTSSLMGELAMDALVSAEMCATAMELGVIFQHFGQGVWTVGLFLNCIWQCLRWQELTFPCPYTHLQRLVGGKQSLGRTLLRTAVLLASGLASYHLLMVPMWTLEMTSLHAGRPTATSAAECTVGIPEPETSVLNAALVEALGTFLLEIGLNLFLENPHVRRLNQPVLEAIGVACMVTVVVSVSINLSGGMFNPLLATVIFGGCKGHSTSQHLTIYWAGSSIGAMVAFATFPNIKAMLYHTASGTKDSSGQEETIRRKEEIKTSRPKVD